MWKTDYWIIVGDKKCQLLGFILLIRDIDFCYFISESDVPFVFFVIERENLKYQSFSYIKELIYIKKYAINIFVIKKKFCSVFRVIIINELIKTTVQSETIAINGEKGDLQRN